MIVDNMLHILIFESHLPFTKYMHGMPNVFITLAAIFAIFIKVRKNANTSTSRTSCRANAAFISSPLLCVCLKCILTSRCVIAALCVDVYACVRFAREMGVCLVFLCLF